MAFEGTREVFARTEQNMLNAVARALARAKNGLNVYVSVRHIARNAEGEINTNLTRDFLGYFGDNAKEQCKAAGASIEFTEQAGKSVRSTADSAFFEASPLMKSFVSNMAKNANADYVSAVAKAKLRSTAVSNEQAVREAVHDLAERGLFVNTYTDKNGRTVNVPVDVGVRQALQNSGKQRRMAQTLEIAEQTGNDLVEVNRTGNCRASHAEWQGGIYSISGKSAKYKSFYKACHVGDPVIGIGGYNCGHEFRIYRASRGRKFQDPITDPAYTTEQVRELTSKQRYCERKLRALKREREMLKSAGLEHAEVSRKITGTQNALKSLIANNKTVLTRQADRERVSPSAIKKSVAGGKNGGGVKGVKTVKTKKRAQVVAQKAKSELSEKQIEDVQEEILASLSKSEKIKASAVRSIISRIVPLGTEKGKNAVDYLDIQQRPSTIELFDKAVEYIPTEMLKALKKAKVKAKRDLKLERSEYDPVSNTISISKNGNAISAVHEIMHAVEEHDKDFMEAEKEYFEKRTKGKSYNYLSNLTNGNYENNEIAYDVGRNCIDPYAFKIYDDGYELMSVGVEKLYSRPAEFIAKDYDMFKWVFEMMKEFGK